MKHLLAFVLSFALVVQSVFAANPDDFFCRRLLGSEDPAVTAELLTVKRLARSPVEVLKVHEAEKRTVELKHIIDPSTEILFGWEMKGRRPILLLYFQNLEVRINVYPKVNGTEMTSINYSVRESSYVEKGIYFAAHFSPQRIDQAVNFVRVTRAVEETLIQHNHTYTDAQRIADLNKLLSFFFLQPLDAARKVGFNQGVLTYPIAIGNFSKSALLERVAAVKRWRVMTEGEASRTSHAAKFLIVAGAVGVAVLIGYGLHRGWIH